MKKIATIGTLAAAVLLAGCATNTTPVNYTTGTTGNSQTNTTSGATEVTPTRKITGMSGENYGDLMDGTTGNIDLPLLSGNNHPTLTVSLMSGDRIHIDVSTDASHSGAALRLSQIISPDNSADGPFSYTNDYTATQSGAYTFIFAQDLMAAEEQYVGNVHVNLVINP